MQVKYRRGRDRMVVGFITIRFQRFFANCFIVGNSETDAIHNFCVAFTERVI
jgi:hypothetical protein